jgi:hypothetical protein
MASHGSRSPVPWHPSPARAACSHGRIERPTGATASSLRWPRPARLAGLSCAWLPAAPTPPSGFGGRTRSMVCGYPPYGPQRHPIARVWRDLHEHGAWEPCAALTAPCDDVANRLQADEAATLPSLAGYPDLAAAIHALYA